MTATNIIPFPSSRIRRPSFETAVLQCLELAESMAEERAIRIKIPEYKIGVVINGNDLKACSYMVNIGNEMEIYSKVAWSFAENTNFNPKLTKTFYSDADLDFLFPEENDEAIDDWYS